MTQSKKIAITGGIGSGKTAFCAELRRRGFAVFSCDEISARLWTEREYLGRLKAAFPGCLTGGTIDKAKLTALVFGDEGARRRLNAIAHPAIMERLLGEMEKCGLSFGEVPLLFEEGLEGLFDGVIALRRPQEQRIASVCARDGLTAEEVIRRAAVQFDAEKLEEKRCFIVENDGSAEALSAGADAALRYFGIG